MSMLMQTPSRLALIALLAAAPAVLVAQTATTTVKPEAGAAATTETTTDAPAGTAATDTGAAATTTTTTEVEVKPEAAAGTVEGAAEKTGEAVEKATEEAAEKTEEAAEETMEATEEVTEEATEEMAEETEEATEEMAEEEVAKPVEGQIVLQDEDTILAKDLIGTRVYSADGESIGEINDVIINLNGSIEGVVIGVGGFLGIGEKDVAIEMNAVSLAADENGRMRLVTSSTKADLEAAEEFVTADQQRAAKASMETMPATDPLAPAADGTAPAGTAPSGN